MPPGIKSLRDLQGFGNVYDLSQAMVRDTRGQLQAMVGNFMIETNPNARNKLMEQIIFKWAGI